MARGDAWRISGGIYIPNSRMLYDSDYNPASNENMPDGWNRGVTGGVLRVSLSSGFSDDRGLHVYNDPSGFTNFIISPLSPIGSFPWRASVSGLQVRLRLRFWYKKSAGAQQMAPDLIMYRAGGTVIAGFGFFTPVTAAATSGWTSYDSTVIVDANDIDRPPIGTVIDSVKVQLRLSGSTPETYHFDDFTLGYQLTDVDGSTGYDTLTCRPVPSGLVLHSPLPGRFERTALGQLRYLDTTGGAHTSRLRATFESLRDSDRKVLDRAIRLHAGLYCPDDDSGSGALPYVSSLVVPSPVVVEPYYGDDVTQSAGKLPENFYAWITEFSEPEPVGYLGNVWRAGVTLEEVG